MTLEDVAKEVAPAYIFNRRKFDRNVSDMLEAFWDVYPHTSIGYSYKTNYTPYACTSSYRHGCYAEVVSQMEYDYAIRLGIDPCKIILNGVCKTVGVIEAAVLLGSIINADSLNDFLNITEAAKRIGKAPRVGIRLNFGKETGKESRFGVEVGSDEFYGILKASKDMATPIIGLHCHLSYSRSAESFAKRARLMANVAASMGGIEYIDLGGKMFGRMGDELARQFSEKPQSYEQYAAAIGGVLKEAFPDHTMELIMEPGTALVSDCMCMAARVTDTKEVAGKRYATIDASNFDLGFAGESKNPPLRVLHREWQGGDEANYAIVGCTCDERDVLCSEYHGKVSIGDTVIVENVGAYTCNLARRFIKPTLPVIEYDGDAYETSMVPMGI